jgi:HSP20 family protein
MPHAEWDPMKELAVVRERMNRMFEAALQRTNFDADGGVGGWAPLADVVETPDSLLLSLEIPGVEQDDIDLRIENDEILIQGERKVGRDGAGEQFHRVERSYGRFARRFALPSYVDRGSVVASYRDGVLTITLRKREGEGDRPIRVAID